MKFSGSASGDAQKRERLHGAAEVRREIPTQQHDEGAAAEG